MTLPLREEPLMYYGLDGLERAFYGDPAFCTHNQYWMPVEGGRLVCPWCGADKGEG